MERYDSPEPIVVPELEQRVDFSRADLVFTGVDHSGPSYEARVFLNNTDATLDTPRDAGQGYAGAFMVFGHGACYGGEGHCDPAREYRDDFDLRLPHPLEPITKTVMITDALNRTEGEAISITVIGAEHAGEEATATDALQFEEVRLLVYEP
jgi:tyrosinase